MSLAKHAQRAAELFDSITVSLDGTCAATYAAIRGVDAFDKVCEAFAPSPPPACRRACASRCSAPTTASCPRFVTLARELGAAQVSFLAVDVSNAHAFARRDDVAPELALRVDDLPVLDALLDALERDHAADFRTRFIAESPAKLRRLRDYFAALLGLGAFPPVRCNAPEFSAVVGVDGRVRRAFSFRLPPSRRAGRTCR